MNVRRLASGILAMGICAALGLPASGQTTPPTPVDDAGTAKPPRGSGIGTAAALTNPKCNADAVEGYGVFPQVRENEGPFCVAAAPKNNGGSTYRGVTRDSITAVVMVPNEQQRAAGATAGGRLPTNLATGEVGTTEDAIRDAWTALAHTYENWGRTVKLVFITSSGDDEAAQRADAVAVRQEKPMFVINTVPSGLNTLGTVLARDRYLFYSFATGTQASLDLAPYLWGQTDTSANAVSAAEFIGKQLAGRKARFAGDDAMHNQKRTFGLVLPRGFLDVDATVRFLRDAGVKLATSPLEYTATGSARGDTATAQAEAPTLIGRLKAAGVTSVILFTDVAMTAALTNIATQQEYRPEWVTTGYSFQDLNILARPSYDLEQWSHAFGLSTLWPNVKAGNADTGGVLDWYWGPNTATTDIRATAQMTWLAAAIHYAGPKLTPQNVKKGFFAIPARGGAASGIPTGQLTGYGRTAGMPYDSYFPSGKDYAATWFDAETTGESQLFPTVGRGVTWYLDGAKRYTSGTWPKAPFKFFEPTGAVYVFEASPVPTSPPVPCTGCPSSGGPGTPSASARAG